MRLRLPRHTGLLVALAAAVALHPRAARADEPSAQDTTVTAVAAALEPLVPAPVPGAAVPFPGAAIRRWQVGLLRPDRMQHASLAMTLALAVGVITREPGTGAAASFGFGLAKELWDVRTTGFDPLDLAADAAGAGVGAFATHAIEF